MENFKPHFSPEITRPSFPTENLETMIDDTSALFDKFSVQEGGDDTHKDPIKISTKLINEKIIDGYQTANELRNVLVASPRTIKAIVAEIIAKRPELEGQVQRNIKIQGQLTDAYSPMLVELISENRGDLMQEGYQTASELQTRLRTQRANIKILVAKLIDERPELEGQVQRNVEIYGQLTEAYSPMLVELIKEELGELVQEGYQTASALQSTLKANINNIKTIVDELIAERPELESQVQRGVRIGGSNKADAYSPMLVELIKEELGELVQEGYQTASALQSTLRIQSSKIKTIVAEIIAKRPELESQVQRGVRSGPHKTDAYSPMLVELISENRGDLVQEGYQTAKKLRNTLGADPYTIKEVIAGLIVENPEIKKQIQKNAITWGKLVDAYSPKLVETVKERLVSRENIDLLNKFRQNCGLVLQHAIEIILHIIHNTNLRIEHTIRISDRKNVLRPDLMHDIETSKRAFLSDIKLQTTTESIREDTENYTQYIKENYPEGGDLIFLCLNGPEFPSEVSETADNIKIRYYHVLDFLERLIDNKRNKFMLRMMAGKESDALGDVPELAPGQIEKVKEIMEQLRVLKELISNQEYSTKDLAPVEASKKMAKIRAHMRKLARGNVSIDDILNTKFKEIMDF